MPDICGLILLFVERSMFEFTFIGLEDNNFTDAAFARFLDTVLYARRNGLNLDFSIVGNPIGDAGAELFFTNYYELYLEAGSAVNLSGCMLTDACVNVMVEVCDNIIARGSSNSIKVLCLNGRDENGIVTCREFPHR